jgi:hypothetical protein
MTREINTTPERLYGDARYAAEQALKDAIKTIDRELGEGYAARNPALVGAYIQAAVTAGAVGNQTRVLERIAERLGGSIDGVAAAVMAIG